jgi:murein DD-endopeptidase MepM/ murein hydrolase activator NlpD
MAVCIRLSLPVALGVLAGALGSIPSIGDAAVAHVAKIEASPGTIVRWSSPRTKRCGMGGRSWTALQETCYYPVDLLEKPGVIKISRRGIGPAEFAQISVRPYPYGTEPIELGNIPQANPSPADLQRNSREQARLDKVWRRREGPARFTLPLGAPANPPPEGKGFGAKWIFNGKPDASEFHTGADYALPLGTPIAAAADGTVVVAEDLFFPGNAVFIDHGDGLITMYFHLSEIKVQAGHDVKRGDTVGLVGLTGRASGPHLHVGVRWHNARVDPQLLFGDPSKIPAVAP